MGWEGPSKFRPSLSAPRGPSRTRNPHDADPSSAVGSLWDAQLGPGHQNVGYIRSEPSESEGTEPTGIDLTTIGGRIRIARRHLGLISSDRQAYVPGLIPC